MRKFSVVSRVSFVIFTLLIILAVVLVRPVYSRLERTIDRYTQRLVEFIEDKTGLFIEYENFSPSILTSFYIKGISVSDSKQQLIGSVKNTRVNYRLTKLFSGEFSEIIRSVIVDGVELDLHALIDYVNNSPLVKPSGQSSASEFDYSVITDYIPANVSVKNVSVLYDDDKLCAELFVREVDLFNMLRRRNIDFQTDGTVRAVIKQADNLTVKGGLFLNGSVFHGLENSSVHIRLSDVTGRDFKVSRLNLVATYKERQIEVSSVQTVNPLKITGLYDIPENKASASIRTDGLSLRSFLNVNNRLLNDFAFSILAGIRFDGNSSSFDYYSSGSVSVPSSVVPDGAEARYSLSGNDKRLDLQSLSLAGPSCDISGSLGLVFKTLQLSGIVDVTDFTLPNGRSVATELYVDPRPDNGFMVFAPQVFVGEKSLTALMAELVPRADSLDFEVEAFDYSRTDASEPGSVRLEGSFLTDSSYVQGSVALNSLYLQSVLQLVAELLPEEAGKGLSSAEGFSEPYMFTTEAYFSTDFSSVSYNVPYFVLANTRAQNQFVLISVNGNEQSVQLNRLDLIFGKLAMNITASLDISPDSRDMFFTVDAVSSSIPYHFSGNILPEAVSVTGEYGTDIQVLFDKNKNVSGHANFENLPFIVEKLGLVLSARTSFSYDEENGPSVTVERLSVEETDASAAIAPSLVISGSGSKYGAQLTSISYTDFYSALSGTADITFNVNGGILDSAGVSMSLKNPVSEEAFVVDAMLSNPDLVELSVDALMKSFYISAMADINHFSLNRFFQTKNSNNEVSGSLSISGTLEHPYALVNVDSLTFLFNDKIASANGSVMLEDKDVTINDFTVDLLSAVVNDVSGNFSIESMTGAMSAVVSTAGAKTVSIPLTVSVEDSYVPEGTYVPQSMLVRLSSEGVGGSLVKTTNPFELSVFYSDGLFAFTSSENIGLTGSFSMADGLNAYLNSADIISGEAHGTVAGMVDIRLSNIKADLNRLCSLLNLEDVFSVRQGILRGSLRMSGTLDTPEFAGAVSVTSPEFSMPAVFKNPVSTDKILITATNNEFVVAESVYRIKNSQKFKLSSHIYMNKWVVDRLELKTATLANERLPLDFKSPYINLKGDVQADVLVVMDGSLVDVTGSVFADDVSIVSNISEVTSAVLAGGSPDSSAPAAEPLDVLVNLDLSLGTHVMLNFNPLLRCIFVPNTKIKLGIDTRSQSYAVDGQLKLKSGDVSYLNRSFYIKEGSIRFNSADITNPQVTINAETRERDSSGKNVRIILSAENQYLKDLNPAFSSVPAKSETEILQLLGQIVIADSGSATDILVSAGDYYLQSTVIRSFENKLRDLMNFDIFSIRPNILQNTLNMSTAGSLFNNKSIGNFLDNSTVYIGKYLGNAVYVDSMLNFSVPDGSVHNISVDNNLLLQPEIGLELDFSILNIRWDMAWDIGWNLDSNSIMLNQYIPTTSLSLSFKFSF